VPSLATAFLVSHPAAPPPWLSIPGLLGLLDPALAAAPCSRRIPRAIASLLSLLLPGFRCASSGPRVAGSSFAAGPSLTSQ